MRKLLPYIFISVAAVYAIYSIFKIILTSAPDFSVLYGSALNLLTGQSLYRNTSLFTGLGYPPQTLWIFIPLSWLNYFQAQLIWTGISAASLIMSVILVLRLINAKSGFIQVGIWSSLAFLSFPTRFTLGMGQSNLTVLFLVIFSVYQTARGRAVLGGLLFGLATLIKPQLLFLLPVFWISNLWVSAGTVMLFHLASAGLFVIIFGAYHFAEYWQYMALPLMKFTGREIYYNQGLAAFFSRIIPLQAQWLTLLCSIFVYTVTVFLVIKKKLNLTESVIMMLPVMLMTEPLSWQHHYVFLLPVYLFLWYRYGSTLINRTIILFSFVLVSLNLKNPQIFEHSLFGNIMLSHVTIGNLLLWIFMLIKTFNAKKPVTDL